MDVTAAWADQGDWVKAVTCPRCRQESVVYNGNYFCGFASCGLANSGLANCSLAGFRFANRGLASCRLAGNCLAGLRLVN
jgi:hypothetical protein